MANAICMTPETQQSLRSSHSIVTGSSKSTRWIGLTECSEQIDMRPAIFLDRDGTINVEVNYLKSPDELRLIDGAAEAINQFRTVGFAVIVVTNQSGIARRYM